jgi:hypothetical protein
VYAIANIVANVNGRIVHAENSGIEELDGDSVRDGEGEDCEDKGEGDTYGKGEGKVEEGDGNRGEGEEGNKEDEGDGVGVGTVWLSPNASSLPSLCNIDVAFGYYWRATSLFMWHRCRRGNS